MKKIKFIRPKTFEIEVHRAGWNWIMDTMFKELHDNNAEVLLDDFIEKTFDWSYLDLRKQGLPHYDKPWIGFIHNPFLVTSTFNITNSALNICSRLPFMRALKNCRGIFTLSEDLRQNLLQIFNKFGVYYVPVNTLMHPTQFCEKTFDIEKFKKDPKITSIGYWLRNFEAFYTLETELPKHALLGSNAYAHYNFNQQMQEFQRNSKLSGEYMFGNVTAHKALDNEEYDEFLTNSVSFLNLIDTSANNGVIECIVRNIPLLVNCHPAVVEYLGEDYPFYYMTQQGANDKINDPGLIEKTYHYLKNMNKDYLSIEYFIKSFKESEIYNNL